MLNIFPNKCSATTCRPGEREPAAPRPERGPRRRQFMPPQQLLAAGSPLPPSSPPRTEHRTGAYFEGLVFPDVVYLVQHKATAHIAP